MAEFYSSLPLQNYYETLNNDKEDSLFENRLKHLYLKNILSQKVEYKENRQIFYMLGNCFEKNYQYKSMLCHALQLYLNIFSIGRFDLDFFSKCCIAQADSVKIGQNLLPDPLRAILYPKGFNWNAF